MSHNNTIKTSNNEETSLIQVNDNVTLNIGSCDDFIKTLDDRTVQMIYLDPPFNSDRNYTMSVDSNVGFDDKWTDETYEKFIDDTINGLKRLLKLDGTLYFHISAACMLIPHKVLVKHFKCVTPIFWKKCRSKNNVKRKLGATIDVIFKCNLIDKPKFNVVLQEKDENYLKNSFNNKDSRGNYSLGHLVTEKTKKGYDYEFESNGVVYNPPSGWRIKKTELEKLKLEDRIHFPKKTNSNLYKKIYLSENPGKPCTDLWDDIHSISQGSEGRKYPTAKPVKLLERLVSISTDKDDFILDPMCGSGTTGSACYNLDRKCLLNDMNLDVVDIVKSRFS